MNQHMQPSPLELELLAAASGVWRADGDDPAVEVAIEATKTALIGVSANAIAQCGRTLAASLEAAPGPAAILAVLLAGQRAGDESVRTALLRAAVLLCEAALNECRDSLPVAVRLARLREALGDQAQARHAWATCVRIDARMAWLLPEAIRSDPAVAAAESEAAVRSPTRAAILQLRDDRASALKALAIVLDQPGDAADARAARVVLAGEQLRIAAQRASDGGHDVGALVDAAALAIDRIEDETLAAILGAIAELLRGERSAALATLTRGMGQAVDARTAEGTIDALAQLVRTPPFDVPSWLRSAYFDAVLDPLGAYLQPRSPLAKLRRHLHRLSLVLLLGSVGCHTVAAKQPNAADLHLDGASPGDFATDAFDDAHELVAPDVGPEARAVLLERLIESDISGANPGAVTRMWDNSRTEDRAQLRRELSRALADEGLNETIEANQVHAARALQIALHIAPGDPSIGENVEARKAVAAYDGWGAHPYDVIVVTGYTPADAKEPVRLHEVAKERLAAAMSAYESGNAPFLIVSGANVYPTDTPYYEAIEMKRELIAMGIPADRILVDAKARHSTTNLRNAGRLMIELGMRRALITAPGGGLGAFDQQFYFGNPELSTFNARCRSELGYVVGDLDLVENGVAFSPSPRVLKLNYRDPLDA